MLKLIARGDQIGSRCLGSVELSLGERDVRPRRDAAIETVVGERQVGLVGLDRVVQQLNCMSVSSRLK